MAYGTLNAGTITPGSGNTLTISETLALGTVASGVIGTAVTGLGWQPVGTHKNTFSTTNWDILGFTNDFDTWMVQLNYFRPSDDAKELKIYFLLDDGSLTSGTKQFFSNQYDSGGATDNQASTNSYYLTAMMSNSANLRSAGTVIIYGARSTSQNTTAWIETNVIKPDGQVGTDRGALKIDGVEVIGGLRLSPYLGNWSEVSAQIYGLKSTI